jgi:hypothetical protein
MNDNITLLDGEEILEETTTHWLGKLMSAGDHGLFKTVEFAVTTDRVIRYVDGLSKSSTDEYPIRDIDQLRTEAENVMDWLGQGPSRSLLAVVVRLFGSRISTTTTSSQMRFVAASGTLLEPRRNVHERLRYGFYAICCHAPNTYCVVDHSNSR